MLRCAKDEEDIMALVKYVDREDLMKRFEQVVNSYARKEEDYRKNFEYILRKYFH